MPHTILGLLPGVFGRQGPSLGPNIWEIMTNYWHNLTDSLTTLSCLLTPDGHHWLKWQMNATKLVSQQSNSFTVLFLVSLIVRTLAMTVVVVFLFQVKNIPHIMLLRLAQCSPKTDEDGFSSDFELTLIVFNIMSEKVSSTHKLYLAQFRKYISIRIHYSITGFIFRIQCIKHIWISLP